MVLLCGGAVVLAPLAAYRLVRSSPDPEVRYMASVVFCLDLFFLGSCFGYAALSDHMGTLFWVLNAALHGAACAVRGLPRMAPGGRAAAY
jgi:hypothetical protein